MVVVVVVGKDFAYAVCNNLWSLIRFQVGTAAAARRSPAPLLDREADEDSGFEALVYDTGSTYSVVRESVEHPEGTYRAVIQKLQVGVSDCIAMETFYSEFSFDSKGAVGVRDMRHPFVLLGLCERQSLLRSSQERPRQRSPRRDATGPWHDGSCIWKTVRTIGIPSSANFRDYSDIASRRHHGSRGYRVKGGQSVVGRTPVGTTRERVVGFAFTHGTVYEFPPRIFTPVKPFIATWKKWNGLMPPPHLGRI